MIAAYRDGAHDVRAQGSVEQHEEGGPDGGAAQQAQRRKIGSSNSLRSRGVVEAVPCI